MNPMEMLGVAGGEAGLSRMHRREALIDLARQMLELIEKENPGEAAKLAAQVSGAMEQGEMPEVEEDSEEGPMDGMFDEGSGGMEMTAESEDEEEEPMGKPSPRVVEVDVVRAGLLKPKFGGGKPSMMGKGKGGGKPMRRGLL